MHSKQQMSEALNDQPISLIGLPYVFGVREPIRGPVPGNAMALGPGVLLASDKAPAALQSQFSDVDFVWLDKADWATEAENGGDYRMIPAGDQMGRILVQNIHLARAVREARAAGRIPIIVPATCSASLGVVGGLGDVEKKFGLIWFDAHGDAMTPETSSNGFIEGMLTTTIAGKCWKLYRRQIPGFREISEEMIISVGIHEPFWEKGRPHTASAIGTVVNPPVISKLGYKKAMIAALDLLSGKTDCVYVHIDTDVLDPSVLRANWHYAEGGLTDKQVSEALAMIADRFEILAVSFSAFDPEVDPRGPEVIVPLILKAAQSAARSRTLKPTNQPR
jgi:arginase